MVKGKRAIEEFSKVEHKFYEILPSATRNEIWHLLRMLHRYETTLQRINENDCNGHPKTVIEIREGRIFRYDVENTEWEARDRKKEISIHKKVVDLLKPYGIDVKFNGDPRGGAIRMLLPDHTSNGWDGETWGIYW